MSEAVTQGIRVRVRTRYLEDQSGPGKHMFMYTIRISNEGKRTAQLLSRHWIITDAHGHEEHVRGPGVIGKQPIIPPDEVHEYSSFCPLPTTHGSMRGTFRMVRPDGEQFDADIAPFALVIPNALN